MVGLLLVVTVVTVFSMLPLIGVNTVVGMFYVVTVVSTLFAVRSSSCC